MWDDEEKRDQKWVENEKFTQTTVLSHPHGAHVSRLYSNYIERCRCHQQMFCSSCRWDDVVCCMFATRELVERSLLRSAASILSSSFVRHSTLSSSNLHLVIYPLYYISYITRFIQDNMWGNEKCAWMQEEEGERKETGKWRTSSLLRLLSTQL